MPIYVYVSSSTSAAESGISVVGPVVGILCVLV